MPTCAICGTQMTQGRARARRTCSAVCRQAAYRRRRAAEVTALRAAAQPPTAAPSRNEPAEPEGDDSPAGPIRAAATALATAAGHTASAAEEGTFQDDSLATLQRRYTELVEAVRAATRPRNPSRNEPTGTEPVQVRTAATPLPATVDTPTGPGPAHPAPSRNEPDRPPRAPKRPRLSRKKALALLDTADIVKNEHYKETGTWDVVAGDTVICHIAPNFNGLRRNGWNAWPHGTTPNRRDHYPTRERAAAAGTDSWLRTVTARPRN
ncbi:hypothetical protein [Kitasatospora sp. NPDC058046]|uniref:hypothetical protein n=1 Tax=Kitasatospora sp. NPDC058046 TaxID=3346312 RepID=UPI0036D85321